MNDFAALIKNTAKEMKGALLGVISLALARKIYLKEIIPEEIKTGDQFRNLIKNIGQTREDGFEFHTELICDQMAIIRHCVEKNALQSAIVLFFTLIEGQLNTVIRILLRIRNYSQRNITEAIQGIDFRTKLNLLIPLLGANPSERVRQIALESQSIRNMVVHYKAKPDIYSNEAEVVGDYDTILNKATDFFVRNPIEKAEKDNKSIIDDCIYSSPEMKQAFELINRFIP